MLIKCAINIYSDGDPRSLLNSFEFLNTTYIYEQINNADIYYYN